MILRRQPAQTLNQASGAFRRHFWPMKTGELRSETAVIPGLQKDSARQEFESLFVKGDLISSFDAERFVDTGDWDTAISKP